MERSQARRHRRTPGHVANWPVIQAWLCGGGHFLRVYSDGALTAASILSTLPGRLQEQETVIEGFDALPEAMLKLLSGANTGKLVVRTQSASH